MAAKTKGYVFVLMALTIFSAQDGISKHLAGAYPPVFVAMIRYWAFAAFALLLTARARGGFSSAIQSRKPWLQVARGLLLASQIVTTITSFVIVGLAHSQAISCATPLIIALLSMPLLGEQVGWRRWTAICVGLAGVLLILKPQGNGFFDVKALLPLFAALLFAFYVIATRLVSRYDSPSTSFFYTGIVGAVAMSLIGPFYWTWLQGWDWAWMAIVCATSITSHYFLIRAYDLLDASAVQPLTYIQLVYASIIGVTVFGETLNINMVIGSVIVVAAGAFTVWREHVVARGKARSA
ncbi:DMT family transporter [Rhizobium sp. BK376]|uniref:DMT family transporter n=1 Tax=Rhizobium sp. BK376 TaxID=2512149 RepID=UPI001046F1A3|nr:DMT family transporter [Rhizobium sp. BK376]TCR92679.1 drug/metabolite transporter (DMT)-like permease [Rhizobium sp. BK376]